ncbi:hypothetical protein Tco_1446780 [Tanacetum coccineum]
MTKGHFKEAGTIRMTNMKGSVLDAETQIIASENVRNHRETRTKGLLLEVLGVITVRNMMKGLKTKRVSWHTHLVRDKSGLSFNSFEASISGTKQIKFVKSQASETSGDDP